MEATPLPHYILVHLLTFLDIKRDLENAKKVNREWWKAGLNWNFGWQEVLVVCCTGAAMPPNLSTNRELIGRREGEEERWTERERERGRRREREKSG
jgi:hypothetical protein